MTTSAPHRSVVVCCPVYNDWDSVSVLIGEIKKQRLADGTDIRFVLLDDGSSESPPMDRLGKIAGRSAIDIISLSRNLGHQRAIAIGLSAIASRCHCDAVVVMDADGEDDPTHLCRLLGDLEEECPSAIVFAQRSRRTEGIAFRLGYASFKALHWLLTGRGCDIGNYSVIPRRWLDRIVNNSEIWNHYAAGVLASRIPTKKVPCPRGHRYAGQSRMNFTALVVHGLRAISVFGETVGVRVLVGVGSLSGLSVLALLTVVYIRVATTLVVPPWATTTMLVALLLLVNILALTAPSVLLLLGARNTQPFVPAHHWRNYVAEWRTIVERAADVPELDGLAVVVSSSESSV